MHVQLYTAIHYSFSCSSALKSFFNKCFSCLNRFFRILIKGFRVLTFGYPIAMRDRKRVNALSLSAHNIEHKTCARFLLPNASHFNGISKS